jgi:hypothetical protein
MAEKVAKLGIKRDINLMYWIADGAVWAIPRKRPGEPQGKKIKVSPVEMERDLNYLYFLDAKGDVSRVLRVKPKVRKAKPKPRSPLAKVKPEQVLGLLGQKCGSPDLEQFLAPLGTHDVNDFKSTFHWGFKKHGLQLMFERTKRQGEVLSSLFFFGKHEPGYKPYPGKLPHGLAFGKRRQAIAAKLGPLVGIMVELPEVGLSLRFRGKSGTDPQATLDYICVSAPAPARARKR